MSPEKYWLLFVLDPIWEKTFDNKIQVFNVLGQAVNVKTTDLGDEIQMDLSALNKGGYIVRSTVFESFKFVK